MARTKKQVKNEKGEGSFRKRSNGNLNTELYIQMNIMKPKENHSMGRVILSAWKRLKSSFMIWKRRNQV